MNKLNLKEKYQGEVVPQLKKDLGLESVMAVPRLEKIVINVGTGKALKDKKILDSMVENVRLISGQAPVKTRARKSISNFGIREGQIVGLKVTLRGRRMYDFLARLTNIAAPRIRDFSGFPTNKFDGRGSYTLGLKEQVVFPEVKSEDVQGIHGLEITLVTTASKPKVAKLLLEKLGFPFKRSE